jgi:uncharacterized protein YdhG (YjbR/CyaY superfamily)
MTTRRPPSESTPITAYVDAAQEPARSRLRTLAEFIRAEAPDAVERIASWLATWHPGENLIHLGAFERHRPVSGVVTTTTVRAQSAAAQAAGSSSSSAFAG